MQPTSTLPQHLQTPIANTLLCPVCHKDQVVPTQWRMCLSCDEAMGVPLNDASPETMRAWTHPEVWPSPRAGRA
jgi:hypothetical protein